MAWLLRERLPKKYWVLRPGHSIPRIETVRPGTRRQAECLSLNHTLQTCVITHTTERERLPVKFQGSVLRTRGMRLTLRFRLEKGNSRCVCQSILGASPESRVGVSCLPSHCQMQERVLFRGVGLGCMLLECARRQRDSSDSASHRIPQVGAHHKGNRGASRGSEAGCRCGVLARKHDCA